ncbi:MAG: aspartate ammonia-lyase [Oscillospiraceae bacterium]|nr:aspartate ammonia-lyase [Oscillospiraceae bacterium]MBQ2792608.1 aspartate ammonia-lyase [Oscillospiraceae bacterium]MBQ3241900.1 aspartate ammonia-lyase [Oscillospiraceae bacterium]MBQ7082035.1 aspartate ammonia-lyase [Oscillospiraceae bacterium]MBR2636177.1 aspartate ammonia-lyase [Oscillospiraceae bacterium]
MRIETDLIGKREIESEAYYGLQSVRAYENFNITGRRAHPEFIRALAAVKKACAITNCQVGDMDEKIKDAIVQACDEILSGKLHDAFITDCIQGGAGTSFNMNANEVIANRAIEILGGEKGDYSIVHPNDHVNMSQSTNDVIPTAGKITAIKLLQNVIFQLSRLVGALRKKEKEFDHILKMGRTQMQDAVPIRLGQEFGAYRAVMERDLNRIGHIYDELMHVNMGGTAIGTAINADESYVNSIVPNLSVVTGLDLRQAKNLVDSTQNLDCFVVASSTLKTCAVSLSKMSNDLRMMSSGPRTGFAEINLPPKQNGSSIMPGKVNPVIPEVVSQVAFSIIGNDMTITMAAEAGQLELNAFEPVIFYKLFESITTLAGGIQTFVDNCVVDITANEDHCKHLVDNSVGIITAICPRVGYAVAADIAKTAIRNGTSVRAELVSRNILSEEEINKLLDPYAMT